MYTAFLWWVFTKRQHGQYEVGHILSLSTENLGHRGFCAEIGILYDNVFERFPGYDNYCGASSMFVENHGFDSRVRKLVYGFRQILQ